MVLALSENERSARRGARSSYSFLSPALGKSLRAMAREHSGLVHQPPGLVGASDTGLVSEAEVSRLRRGYGEPRGTEVGGQIADFGMPATAGELHVEW